MTTIALLGVGLIGGSIGLAARERAGASVRGFDAAPGVLEAALARGAIDVACDSIAEALEGAEAAFVAVPVGAATRVVGEALGAASASCVVTDVGSTKRGLVEVIRDSRFVGGHPLAGAETAGVEHARADLFVGATWYLTPTPSTEGALYERLHRLLRTLGAAPTALDAATHDRLLAAVSHLPHVLANVLVARAARALDEEGERLPAVGPSFRDATRVAGAPSAIWTDIYRSNAVEVLAAVDDAIDRLREFRTALAADDAAAITAWNDAAGEDRQRLLASGGAAGPTHELRVTVPNRPGVVAEVALGLGGAAVNILDMTLHPAPDGSTGVIALWLAGEAPTKEAERVLAGLGLTGVRG